ncbi:hypothetical protein [Deinococcus humi]|uniref:Uncharacterized protein n=1 Tax=Deinococcus humi TaxID=662880 RepID=A0A7W8JWQ5_9DEIO|nr:hypothetical protein [Deinococcus humi]MBB5364642.1 hypothetical protein [Deinococcus humi]
MPRLVCTQGSDLLLDREASALIPYLALENPTSRAKLATSL